MQYASEPRLPLVVIAREGAKEPATKTEADIPRDPLAAFFGDEFTLNLLIANQGGAYAAPASVIGRALDLMEGMEQ